MSTLIIHKDDENTLNKNKTKENKTILTNSQAIYRISPIYLNKINNKEEVLYPKVKINSISNEQDFENLIFKAKNERSKDIKLDIENIEDLTLDRDILDINFNLNNTSNDLNLEIKKPEDETDTRKYFDKFNLLQGFLIVNDPYNIKSRLIYDQNELTESELKFENLNDRLENLFQIK